MLAAPDRHTILRGMSGKRSLLVVLFLAVAAWTPLRERIVTPDPVKSVAVLVSEEVRGRNDDLTAGFRDLVAYELRQVPWFEVADREVLEDAVERFHRDDPARHLLSFHVVVWIGGGTNGGLTVTSHFPRTGHRESVRRFRFRDRREMERAASGVREELARRLPLSGEVLEVRGGRVVVNLGAESGVREGSYWVAFRSNLRPVAVLRLDRLHGRASEMVVTRREERVSEGDAVMPADPDVLSHYHSRRVQVDGRTNLTVATAVVVPDIMGRTMKVWRSPHDDAFTVWDGRTLLFFHPVRKRSVVLARGGWVERLVWRPGTHTVAYGAGPDLWVHDTDRGRRWRLVAKDDATPVFKPVETVFDVTNRREVLDFVWDEDGSRFAFFLAGKGLFLTEGVPGTAAVRSVPGIHPEAAGVSLLFGSEGDSLWVRTANHFDRWATVVRLGLQEGTASVWEDCVGREGIVAPPDGDGVLAHRVDEEGRTNLWRLSGWGAAVMRQAMAAMPTLSSGMDAGFAVRGWRLSGWGDGGGPEEAPWRPVRSAEFFPATSRLAVSGFVADSNRDGVVDWKDNGEVFLTRPAEWRKAERLVEHCDEFYGFTATGRYAVYRKGDRLYWAEVRNQGSVLTRAPVAGSRTR